MTEKVVLVSGHFNIIHPGHLRLFRFAKDCGTRLVVAVESDQLAGDAAYVPEQLRLEGVRTNSYVDEAFLFSHSISCLIDEMRPAVVVKGKEHETRENPEAQVLSNYGGELLFSSGETIFSSLDLIRQELDGLVANTISLPLDFMKRHGIRARDLSQICGSFGKLRVLVIGDLIIDEYITCQPLGLSQEEPSIVVTPIDTLRFVGGAGIVAAHAAGLGADVDFISVTGSDDGRDFSKEKLRDYRVRAYLLEDTSRPTTIKQRYRSQGKSLLRVSHLHQGAISADLQKKVLEKIESFIADVDLLVFSDFNYGCLPQAMVEAITKLAKSHGVVMAADSQSSSQIGDVGRFHGMDLITPTEREARLATRNHEDGLVVLIEKLMQKADAQHVLLKMGEEGLLIHTRLEDGHRVQTDQGPALNSHPKDVAGAGDSLLIASAMAKACGASIWEASCLGLLAAAVQVGRLGNTPLQTGNLLKYIQS